MKTARYLCVGGPSDYNGHYATAEEGARLGYEVTEWPGTNELVLMEAASVIVHDEEAYDAYEAAA